MKTLKLDISKAGVEITPRMEERTREALSLLYSKQGAGNDFLGWVTLPSSIAPQELLRIGAEAKKLRECADVIICIGIGGSYLGAKAVAEAMGDSFAALRPRKEPVVEPIVSGRHRALPIIGFLYRSGLFWSPHLTCLSWNIKAI